MPDIRVPLVNAGGDPVVDVSTDAVARFEIEHLAPGDYMFRLPGFTDMSRAVHVTASPDRCETPLIVTLVLAEECSPPSGVKFADPR